MKVGDITHDEGFEDGANTDDDYNYDLNGNLIMDANKNITSISYNHLNLPTEIKFNNSDIQKINYTYTANGMKVRKVVNYNGNITTTDYAGNFIYEDDQLRMFFQPEGYVQPDGNGGFEYVYQYKDYLGNIRLSYSDMNSNGSINPDTEILDENNYYPFGLEHKGYNNVIVGAENNYKTYQSKELEKELGLNWHDFGARRYMADIGRWISVDPLASEFPSWTPYHFVHNNPINLIDPDGRAAMPPSTDVTKNEDGSYTVVGAYDDGDNNIYVVGADGKRTGETIGTTMQPTDFMGTDDNTGGFSGYISTTFSLDNLTVTGSVKPNKHTTSTIYNADAQRLLDWGMQLFRDEVTRQSPSTFYGELEILRDMSQNDGPLDFKVSLGYKPYTAIKAGNTSDGKPIITTLRAMGNMTFGANMRSTKPYLLGSPTWYYSKVMKQVGAYNQRQNQGNGYNSGFPYFGEHTYSGSYIYYGYFGNFYKK